MFYLDKNKDLTIEILSKMLNKFNSEIKPKRKLKRDYYDGKQKILKKQYEDASKPNSKIVTNFCKNIADSYAGYLSAPGHISYKAEDGIDFSTVMDVLKYNDYQSEDNSFLLDYLVYGFAAELMYIDEDSQLRFSLIDPLQCFAVVSDDLNCDLRYFVRFYAINEWDNSNTFALDVYSNDSISHYEMAGENGMPRLISSVPHFFNQCPANIFTNEKEENIFECIMTLQDAYNETLSNECDDYSAFCDAYLLLTGGEIDAEDAQAMRESRIMMLPENATAQWLTKNANDTQVENQLKRCQASIYRIAQCPDFSSESFVGGVSSGIAIKYRLTGMETRAANICAIMEKALKRRIELIAGFASLKLGTEVFRDIDIVFTRNIPEDYTALSSFVSTLSGVVSNKTLLSQLPFIPDVDAEIERIEEQKKSNIELYSFNTVEEEEEV